MKLKLTVIALVVVAAALVGVSYRDYKHHQNVVVQHNNTEQQVSSELQSARKANSVLVAKYNDLVSQCNAGYGAWTNLTGPQKNTIKAPVCGLAIAQ